MQTTLKHFPTLEDFLKKRRNFSVVRILSREYYLHKDANKCEEFETLEEANIFYKKIVTDKKADYI